MAESAPRLYLIISQEVCGSVPLLQAARRVLEAYAGLGLPPGTLAVQLREKHLSAAALLGLAHPLHALTQSCRVPLFINDRLDVALAVGAEGVHLGERSLPLEDAVRVAPSLAFAISTHAPLELSAAASLRSGGSAPQLVFGLFGPVYDTPSKRVFGPPQGIGRLREATAAAGDLPVLALGGIDADPARRADVLAAGARGIACMRAVWASPDPAAALKAMLSVPDPGRAGAEAGPR